MKLADEIDKYLAKPIRYDLSIVALFLIIEYAVSILWHNMGWPMIHILDRDKALDYIDNLIAGTVSLAGFMIAALTILITVKASLKVRGIEDAENALEIILSSNHYQNIIAIFKHTIIELVLIFISLYVVWIYSENVSNLILFKSILSCVFLMIVSMSRSLYILFGVLDLENFKKEE